MSEVVEVQPVSWRVVCLNAPHLKSLCVFEALSRALGCCYNHHRPQVVQCEAVVRLPAPRMTRVRGHTTHTLPPAPSPTLNTTLQMGTYLVFHLGDWLGVQRCHLVLQGIERVPHSHPPLPVVLQRVDNQHSPGVSVDPSVTKEPDMSPLVNASGTFSPAFTRHNDSSPTRDPGADTTTLSTNTEETSPKRRTSPNSRSKNSISVNTVNHHQYPNTSSKSHPVNYTNSINTSSTNSQLPNYSNSLNTNSTNSHSANYSNSLNISSPNSHSANYHNINTNTANSHRADNSESLNTNSVNSHEANYHNNINTNSHQRNHHNDRQGQTAPSGNESLASDLRWSDGRGEGRCMKIDMAGAEEVVTLLDDDDEDGCMSDASDDLHKTTVRRLSVDVTELLPPPPLDQVLVLLLRPAPPPTSPPPPPPPTHSSTSMAWQFQTACIKVCFDKGEGVVGAAGSGGTMKKTLTRTKPLYFSKNGNAHRLS